MSAPNVSDGAGLPEWAGKLNFVDAVLQTVQLNGGDANRVNITGARQAIIDLRFAITRHCPVGCAAKEVGDVERKLDDILMGLCLDEIEEPRVARVIKPLLARIVELEAVVKEFNEHGKMLWDWLQKISPWSDSSDMEWADEIDCGMHGVEGVITDLRAQLAISGNEVIRLNGLLRVAHTERNDALRSTSAPAYNEEEVRMKIAGILLSTNIIKDTTDKILALFTPAPTAPVGDGALVADYEHLLTDLRYVFAWLADICLTIETTYEYQDLTFLQELSAIAHRTTLAHRRKYSLKTRGEVEKGIPDLAYDNAPAAPFRNVERPEVVGLLRQLGSAERELVKLRALTMPTGTGAQGKGEAT